MYRISQNDYEHMIYLINKIYQEWKRIRFSFKKKIEYKYNRKSNCYIFRIIYNGYVLEIKHWEEDGRCFFNSCEWKITVPEYPLLSNGKGKERDYFETVGALKYIYEIFLQEYDKKMVK